VSHRPPDQRRYHPAATQRRTETVFKTVAFVRSAILPSEIYLRERCHRTRRRHSVAAKLPPVRCDTCRSWLASGAGASEVLKHERECERLLRTPKCDVASWRPRMRSSTTGKPVRPWTFAHGRPQLPAPRVSRSSRGRSLCSRFAGRSERCLPRPRDSLRVWVRGR
jgi:hypothetical protein